MAECELCGREWQADGVCHADLDSVADSLAWLGEPSYVVYANGIATVFRWSAVRDELLLSRTYTAGSIIEIGRWERSTRTLTVTSRVVLREDTDKVSGIAIAAGTIARRDR